MENELVINSENKEGEGGRGKGGGAMGWCSDYFEAEMI